MYRTRLIGIIAVLVLTIIVIDVCRNCCFCEHSYCFIVIDLLVVVIILIIMIIIIIPIIIGTIVSVSEKRLLTSFGEESIRLKISEPLEYRGWITEKAHITALIEDEATLAANAAENADPEITAELVRRSSVRAHRDLLAVKHSKQISQKLVKLSGTLDVSEETFFLLNGAQKKPGVGISADFTSGNYNGLISVL